MSKSGPSTFQERIHRIQGQLTAIERQINNGEEPSKILIQVEAVISSVQSLKLEIVKGEVKRSLLAQIDASVSLLK